MGCAFFGRVVVAGVLASGSGAIAACTSVGDPWLAAEPDTRDTHDTHDAGDADATADVPAETSDTGAPDTSDTSAPETSDTSLPDTSDTSAPETSDTSAPDTARPDIVATDCSGLTVCDDFEGAAAGGPPDPARWSVVSPNCSGAGTLTIDGAVAHGGSRALRIDGGGGYCDHVFASADVAALADAGPVWARFYVRFDAALGQGHTTFLTMQDAADSNRDLRMGGQSGIFMWNRESDDATLPVLSPTGIAASVAPTPGAWTCVELEVDEAAGTIRTWVEGDAVAGLVMDAVATPDIDKAWVDQRPGWKPDLRTFRLGWESYAGQALDVWFDDVAVGGARIGCLDAAP